MTNQTKAQKAVAGKIKPGKAYPADGALKLVKECAHAKFAESVDVARSELVLKDGRLRYDYLVVATGARHAYFGHDEW